MRESTYLKLSLLVVAPRCGYSFCSSPTCGTATTRSGPVSWDPPSSPNWSRSLRYYSLVGLSCLPCIFCGSCTNQIKKSPLPSCPAGNWCLALPFALNLVLAALPQELHTTESNFLLALAWHHLVSIHSTSPFLYCLLYSLRSLLPTVSYLLHCNPSVPSVTYNKISSLHPNHYALQFLLHDLLTTGRTSTTWAGV